MQLFKDPCLRWWLRVQSFCNIEGSRQSLIRKPGDWEDYTKQHTDCDTKATCHLLLQVAKLYGLGIGCRPLAQTSLKGLGVSGLGFRV